MTARGLLAVLGVAGLALQGCKGHEFEPPDRERQVERADSLYSSAIFDTVSWESPEVRARDGNVVYASSCRRCHGTLGRGDTDYARARDLNVPSLVRPDWEFDTVDRVRRRIFTGHVEGMPTFGVARLSPREIDAVAYYLLEVLRPDARKAEAEGRAGGT